jgi:hypothetical protein
MCGENALNLAQTGLPGFFTILHYIIFEVKFAKYPVRILSEAANASER